MGILAPHEMTRPYFDRERRRGLRVIFSWRPGMRQEGGICRSCRRSGRIEDCPTCTMEPCIEGVQFADERAFQNWIEDCWYCAQWERFETWEEAETWLGQD